MHSLGSDGFFVPSQEDSAEQALVSIYFKGLDSLLLAARQRRGSREGSE